MRLIFNWAILIAFSLSFSVAEAMPSMPRQSSAMDGQHVLLVSAQSQKSRLKSLCQRKFGERFMELGKAHGHATCLLRDSTAKLEKRGAKSCNKSGSKFVKILRIRVKGHKYITTFMCKHFGNKSHLREA
jgi:hypothetical protein